ncbi:MAG TPA: sulfatase [bacterium]|nr:sulfatase [bacterium]
MRDRARTGAFELRTAGLAVVAPAAALAVFCILEWLVLLARLPVEWSVGITGLVLRNTLLYAVTGLVVGVALGVLLAVVRRMAGSRVRDLTSPSGVWSITLAGAITFYWVHAVNVLSPGGAGRATELVLYAGSLIAGLALAVALARWMSRGAGGTRALFAGALVALLFWLPFYVAVAGRAGERITGGLDLGRVSVKSGSSDSSSSPNILLIMLDTTRTDCLGCYGARDGVTPNIDKLAEESLLFEQAVTPEPLTRPAVSTMLTGLYPRSHGVDNNTRSLDDGFVTLAEALQKRGYVTGAFMAASVLSSYYGTDQGFDTYSEPIEGTWELSRFLALKRLHSAVVSGSSWSVEIPAGEVTRRAEAWIRNNRDRSFFAFVHYFDPHFPYEPPAECDLARLRGFTTLPVPYEHPQDRFKAGFDMPGDFLEMTWLKYKGEILFADKHVGALLDSVDDMGLTDDTIVILLSDHGESFEKGFYFAHGNRLFDSLVHVALMFRCPGRISPGRVASQVSLADLYPTVLSLAGIPSEAEIQGKDIIGTRGEGLDETSRPVFLQTDFENPKPFSSRVSVGVRLPEWKYVDSPELGLVELYDLSDDPGELRNLAEERAEVASGMAGLLESWLAATELREAERAELSPERLEALRALGYVQ